MKELKKSFFLIFIFLVMHVNAYTQTSSFVTDPDTITIIQGLDTPWEILWGPDDFIWMTERPGRISRVNPETGDQFSLLQIPDVYEESESGLLGMVLHPDFTNFPYVYVAYNYLVNVQIQLKIVRYIYNEGSLISPLTLLDSIAGNSNHNGCRLIIGSDNKMYVTTGDAQNTSLAQNLENLSGKILRMNLDGTVPDDNPIEGSYIWSFGHRNPQGLVEAPNGRIYSSEHGPSNDDEFNLIEKDRNYGWPDIQGFCNLVTEQDFCSNNNIFEPLLAWTPTLAVAGIDFYTGVDFPEWDNSVLMVCLKASRLLVLNLNPEGTNVISENEYFNNWWGRLRDVCISRDGRVFISTSNRDGRGVVKAGDDRIVEIKPVISTGTNGFKGNTLSVFPNPVIGNSLKINNLPVGHGIVTIADVSGKIIYRQPFSCNNIISEIPFNWKSGIYILNVFSGYQVNNILIVKP